MLARDEHRESRLSPTRVSPSHGCDTLARPRHPAAESRPRRAASRRARVQVPLRTVAQESLTMSGEIPQALGVSCVVLLQRWSSTSEGGLNPITVAEEDAGLGRGEAGSGLGPYLVVKCADHVACGCVMPAIALTLGVAQLRGKALSEALRQVERGDVVREVGHLLARIRHLDGDVSLREVVV